MSRALREAIQAVPSLAWADHLQLTAIEGEVARFQPTPGHREVVRFATDRHRSRLAAELVKITGARLRVEIHDAAANAAPDPAQEEAAPSSRNAGRIDRQDALDLPLVRDVMEAFPDSMIVDAREAKPKPPGANTNN